ncbi:hypothetical protein Syun_029904 [Stephania yunnanensis]|uniref:Uncharacterized protein n=1 Tax=Stephania yunnanensis TaxID=152371 RepID=A0AAP0HLT1_9MAGN
MILLVLVPFLQDPMDFLPYLVDPELVLSLPDLARSSPELFLSPTDLARSSPDFVISRPDLAISSPNLVFSLSDLVISSPDLVISHSDLVISSPELVISLSDLVISSPDLHTESKITQSILSFSETRFDLTSSETESSLLPPNTRDLFFPS